MSTSKKVFKDSTLISEASYDHSLEELVITFNSGSAGMFVGVPQIVVTEFYNSESPGRFYHKNISGKYTSTKYL